MSDPHAARRLVCVQSRGYEAVANSTGRQRTHRGISGYASVHTRMLLGVLKDDWPSGLSLAESRLPLLTGRRR